MGNMKRTIIFIIGCVLCSGFLGLFAGKVFGQELMYRYNHIQNRDGTITITSGSPDFEVWRDGDITSLIMGGDTTKLEIKGITNYKGWGNGSKYEDSYWVDDDSVVCKSNKSITVRNDTVMVGNFMITDFKVFDDDPIINVNAKEIAIDDITKIKDKFVYKFNRTDKNKPVFIDPAITPIKALTNTARLYSNNVDFDLARGVISATATDASLYMGMLLGFTVSRVPITWDLTSLDGDTMTIDSVVIDLHGDTKDVAGGEFTYNAYTSHFLTLSVADFNDFPGWETTTTTYTPDSLGNPVSSTIYIDEAYNNIIKFHTAGEESLYSHLGDSLQVVLLTGEDIGSVEPAGNRYIFWNGPATAGEEPLLKIYYTPTGPADPPEPPISVVATTNLHDKVTITWDSAATGGTVIQYAIMCSTQGGSLDSIGQVNHPTTTYDDATTGIFAVNAPTNLYASLGTYQDKIELTFSGATVTDGTSKFYRIKAINADGDATSATNDEGYRSDTIDATGYYIIFNYGDGWGLLTDAGSSPGFITGIPIDHINKLYSFAIKSKSVQADSLSAYSSTFYGFTDIVGIAPPISNGLALPLLVDGKTTPLLRFP